MRVFLKLSGLKTDSITIVLIPVSAVKIALRICKIVGVEERTAD